MGRRHRSAVGLAVLMAGTLILGITWPAAAGDGSGTAEKGSGTAEKGSGTAEKGSGTEAAFRATERMGAPVVGAVPDALTVSMVASLTATAEHSRYLGPALSGLVVDADGGTVEWRYDASRARMPASVQKLLTAYTVLRSMDPGRTLATSVCRNERTGWALYVRGGGDPSLTSARATALARKAAAVLQAEHRSRVALYVDGTIFPAPTPARGWRSSYVGSEVQPVRGLTLAGYRGADGRLAVGTVVRRALVAEGITVTSVSIARSPGQCTSLAVTRSPSVGRLVAGMLTWSNNDYAEYLLRQAAISRGYRPTWQGALANARRLLAAGGVPTAGLQLFDGSGLSRSDRVRVATVAAVVRRLHDDPVTAAIVFGDGGLPIAGRTGTLAHRFGAPNQTCARGRVQAKTGSLSDAVALAGIAHSEGGHERVFVLLDTGLRSNAALRQAVDTMATIVVGCSRLDSRGEAGGLGWAA